MKTIEISKKQMIKDYNSLTIAEICRKYGLCIAHVYRLLDGMNIPRKRIEKGRKHAVRVIVKD